MEQFIQQLVNGLVTGSMYALIALGYTMVYGILNLINFAHGDVLMIGAMTAMTVIKLTQTIFPDWPGWLLFCTGLLVATPVCIFLNIGIERFAYRPLRNKPRLAPLITAIGVALLLQVLAKLFFGTKNHTFPDLLPTESINILSLFNLEVFVTPTKIITLISALIVMFGLIILVEKTKMGRAMRATAENPTVAGLMGVNTNRVISFTFGLGAALAALAGLMIAANYSIVNFYMGFLPGLKAFIAAVLGGIGNIYGAMLGGILLGVIESMGAGYIGDLTGNFLGSNYQDIFAFIVLIIVLSFRPNGIMGERVGDRA